MVCRVGKRRLVTLSQGVGVLPSNNEVGALGDSITAANVGLTVGTLAQRDARGFGSWAAALCGQRVVFPAANSKGVGGNTSAQMLARINDVTSLSAGTITVLAGTNDAGGSVFLDTYQSNIESIIAAIRAAGKVVILVIPPPRDDITGGLTAGQVALLIAYRDWLRTRARPAQGVYLADAWNDIAAVTDGATAKAGYLRGDGIHPTVTGSWWLGYRVAQVLKRLIAARDPWDFDGASLCVNSALAGTTGTKGTGWTGSVATSWVGASETLTGDQAVAVSKVTVDGIERQRIAISGTFGSGFNPAFSQTLAGWGATYTVGDIMSMAVNYEIIQGGASLKNVFAGIVYKSGAVVADLINSSTEQVPSDQNFSALTRVYRFTQPADATRLTPQFGLSLSAGTHNLIIDFWRPHLIKHTS